MNIEDYMSVSDAAKTLGIRERTLRRRISRGTVSTAEIYGKQVIAVAEVNRLKKDPPKKGAPKKRSVS